MSEPTDLIAQADALILRHRRYVARPDATPPDRSPAPFASAMSSPEDVPVLTDIVEDAGASSPEGIDSPQALERYLAEWLEETLPTVVSALTPMLVAELQRRLVAALSSRLSGPTTPALPEESGE
ncbi:MAG: hypothetical protein N2441_08945 [Rhodocyclaceae bacterium]|nr:hypothetical protein [Rhodocyclaceae bacterium]